VNAADGRWCININEGSTEQHRPQQRPVEPPPVARRDRDRRFEPSGFVSDYNSLMDRMSPDGDATILDLAEWQALGYDAHSFVATPAHALPRAAAATSTSSCRARRSNAGTAAGAPSVDLDGNPRPVGAGVDVGAYELQLLECGDAGPIRESSAASPACRAPTASRASAARASRRASARAASGS
jgi:hypothetical protein